MGNKKRVKSDAEKSSQRRRTHVNKIRKYERLLKKFPNSPHTKVWEKKLEHSRSRI